MLYSSACEYAIRALTYMADQPDRRIRLREISEAEGIPAPFLANILHRLVGAGILSSARGPTGGYALVPDPSVLTLLEIKAVVDGLQDLEACVVGGWPGAPTPCPAPSHDRWKPVRARIRTFLEQTTLAAMAAAREGKEEGGGAGVDAEGPERRRRKESEEGA